MADIHIERTHALGLPEARKIALQWAAQAEQEFGMECSYEEGGEGVDSDLLSFSRSGVQGTLAVTPERFVLQARLGFLLGVFKDKIEGEIVRNLDTLIAAEPVPDPLLAPGETAARKA